MIKRAICTFLLLTIFSVSVYAAEKITVTSENIKTNQGETIVVPIELENNTGIMGARLKIKYPESILELEDISSGELTMDGLFNTTVTDYYSVKGEFDVLWSSTEAIAEDGTFVILTFKISDLAEDGKYDVNISYSQEDTFDEDLNDVILKCEPVKIFIGEVPTQEELTEISTTQTEQNEETNEETNEEKNEQEQTNAQTETSLQNEETKPTVSDDFLISSFESILNSYNFPDLESIDEQAQQNILDFVNNRLDSFSENTEKFETFEELKKAYLNAKENEAVKDIIESTDSEIILEVFDEVKEQYDVEKLEDIPEEKKQEVINKFTDKLIEKNSEIESFNKLEEEQKIPVLDEIIEKVQEQEANSVDVTEETTPQNDNEFIVVIFVVVLILIMSITTILIIVRKKKEKKV